MTTPMAEHAQTGPAYSTPMRRRQRLSTHLERTASPLMALATSWFVTARWKWCLRRAMRPECSILANNLTAGGATILLTLSTSISILIRLSSNDITRGLQGWCGGKEAATTRVINGVSDSDVHVQRASRTR